ncbi:hypothetical protein CAPTEDRAFT_213257 [Capitella teleta]|uniref:Uncharacterized protein n=1 Tax=Capitella teleta TaxID=283909 RepID=R7UQ70_CAPTE|nr:hypothetical protein CAPTEDRAFT_213257 [Capitella teleta]|eukprot:ELU08355.1 hypothetical protein CAPTEDRAFT_213257 [Capitella teleta]
MTREASPDVPATADASATEETFSRHPEESPDRQSPTQETSTPAPDHRARNTASSRNERHDTLTSMRSRSSSIQTKKERLIYEIKKDETVFEKTEKPLEDAIEKHQEEDREAYQVLIKQNVTLSRENRKLVDQTQEQSAQMEVLKVELSSHQERNGELETKVKDMEGEIRALVKAAQKRGIPRPQTAVEDENNNRDEEIEESESPEVRQRKQQQKRIRDLQYRLLRMTTDMEHKDHRLERLERKNRELVALVEEYEPLVDSEKVGEVRGRVCADPKVSEEKHVHPRGNVIRQTGGASSSVCIVM